MVQHAMTALPHAGASVGSMALEPHHGPVGTQVRVRGERLPANTALDIVWETYTAGWKLEQRDGVAWNEFLGIYAAPCALRLAQVKTDGDGRLQAVFHVPEDYGGTHEVYLVDAGQGRKVNKDSFQVDLSVSLDPPQGPLGTPITLTARGLNPVHPLEGWYQLCYDNKPVGFLSAVTTRGTTSVEIPATGDPGRHLISIEKASFGAPFLGVDTTPYYYTKTFQLLFDLSEGPAVMPGPIGEQMQMDVPGRPPKERLDRPQLWIDPQEFPAGMAFTVHGSGFPGGRKLELHWFDVYGDRVSELQPGRFGEPFQEERRLLCNATPDADGRFATKVIHEGSQGGPHAIEASLGGQPLAKAYARVNRRTRALHPKAGPVGTPITLEVEGVGWTEYENILAVVYDNCYLGYKCGNDLLGKGLIKMHAAGKPGWHFIDLYPAFYRNQNFSDAMEMPFLYQKPVLSWQDHPQGFHFRYAFKVEGGPADQAQDNGRKP